MSDERRIVYVVTEGSYSEYGIVSIWENKEDAEKVATARGGHPEAEVEEWSLNQRKDLARRTYDVWLSSRGAIRVKDTGIGGDRNYGEAYRRSTASGIGAYYVWVTATSPEKARKIGLDLITQKKAQDGGIT